MKVTVCFDKVKIVVPCGDGNDTIEHLMAEACRRYKTNYNNHDLEYKDMKLYLEDGGILDPNDRIADVIDDKEHVFVTFEVKNISDHLNKISTSNNNLLIETSNHGDRSYMKERKIDITDINNNLVTNEHQLNVGKSKKLMEEIRPGNLSNFQMLVDENFVENLNLIDGDVSFTDSNVPQNEVVITIDDLKEDTKLKVRHNSDPCLNRRTSENFNKSNKPSMSRRKSLNQLAVDHQPTGTASNAGNSVLCTDGFVAADPRSMRNDVCADVQHADDAAAVGLRFAGSRVGISGSRNFQIIQEENVKSVTIKTNLQKLGIHVSPKQNDKGDYEDFCDSILKFLSDFFQNLYLRRTLYLLN
ncbi:hypothetical protein HELRODRAFT_159023 [Helobdella robusta]|uniref:Par3/HAL N-terminal domain-containing protein n=1 Tax=Helobdella robusta TaxID=6412 RepID=T1ENH6_HELRO|nr:hypothetical protein HELRODRAFT_159023 [Helobdella robusta]ESO12481.1 hypothetical protein HELRODRAFT_159023 [Helobdella robusta]